jgi:4-alpha-glucanotransferase
VFLEAMLKTLKQRSAGVLCHISSLPGPWACGDLGPTAVEFVRFLEQAGQSWWQMLPCHPTGAGDSPYQALSSFAGNPLFISLERLVEKGWLEPEDLKVPGSLREDRASMGAAFEFRFQRLRKAQAAFERLATEQDRADYLKFCSSEAYWLEDWALFASIKRFEGGKHWVEWEPGLRDRHIHKLAEQREKLASELAFEKFVQYLFESQWSQLKAQANARGVGLVGDLPIFASHDSADVWAKRELFDLGADGQPVKVAGVPPDYFSEEGQRWGNPLYLWKVHQSTHYAWWIARFYRALKLFDAVRVDHFIGFHRYWEIPSASASAKDGAYALGPGADFFEALKKQFPVLPIIAEDLGVVTEEVTRLRESYGLPGMRVLQFSFGGEAAQLPDHYLENTIVYTGTHDNDTTVGWLSLDPLPGSSAAQAQAFRMERQRALGWVRERSHEAGEAWPFIAAAFETRAVVAITPLQDLLELDSAARMNTPGTSEGNWHWRAKRAGFKPELAARLRRLTEKYGRI